MKFCKILIATALLGLVGCTQREQTVADYAVVPLPCEISVDSTDGFVLKPSTKIAYPAGNDALALNAEHLAGYIEALTGSRPAITDGDVAKNVIRLADNLDSDNAEAYRITVDPTAIIIDGASAAGNFYGIQTLRKSITPTPGADVYFPAAVIADAPRFGYRGAHLDVARHFFPADSVKTFIDMLALHNMNVFHWHLTDDQGWRIEIKSRPELAAKASMRDGTVIGHNTGEYDSIPHGGFYTQDEISDVVRYAADRYITVIPEIDMPGHMQAALHAYPELGCTGGPYEVWQCWGVTPEVLCAGNDSVYAFVDDVLTEVVALFPAEYVHVGGDECPKTRWKECAKCQARIRALGLHDDKNSTKEQKLQSHFMQHAADFLASNGKKMIGWDEILEGGIAGDATIMSWRGTKGGIAAATQGHDAIMTPYNFLYFDYYQVPEDQRDGEPDAIGGCNTLDHAYSFEPVAEELTPEQAKYIIGVQGNLWTEYIPTFWNAQYMALPRYAALAEIQWCQPDTKDFEAFQKRLPQFAKHYDLAGFTYSRHGFPTEEAVVEEATDAVAETEK